ncbi:MAG: DUF2927 domain-containing protein [Chloroflexi bacterium]|nr:DUF2927 domain-containing protein [Chloroflexota bacterium]
MLPYQVQSILYAILALVVGVFSADVPVIPADESISIPVPVVVESRVRVDPATSSSSVPESSSTEVLSPEPVIHDGVPASVEPEQTVLGPSEASALLPVFRQETQPLTNLEDFGVDAVDYLAQIGFGAEYGSSSAVLHRWEDDVRIKVHGEPTEADLATLRQVAQELDSLIPDLTLQIMRSDAPLTDEDPNVDVHFLPESRFALVDPQYVPVNLGFFRVWWDDDEVINRGRILISTQGVSQTERSHLIREELTQTLGLFMDSWQYEDSVFYQGWTATGEYSPLDREVIRLLYSPQLETGMGLDQLRSSFAAD